MSSHDPLPMIVVGGLDLGESDRLVRFLSATEGRSAAVVRGARKSHKRFGGLLDPGTRVLVAKRKGRGSLPVVGVMDLIKAPDRARRDLERIALLAWGCELCSSLAPEDHPAEKLTGLLEVWLDLLEGDVVPRRAACEALEAKALTFAGLAPVLDRCARCGEAVGGELMAFNAEAGGVLHPWCGTGADVTPTQAARLERLRRTPLAEIVNDPSRDDTGGVRWILTDFLTWHLGRPLKSRALLDDVLGTGGPAR